MIYSITEGHQAEEYKARKAKEAEDTKKKETETAQRRAYAGIQDNKRISSINGRSIGSMTDTARDYKSKEILKKEEDSRISKLNQSDWKDKENLNNATKNLGNYIRNYASAKDTINRHMRRHPKQYKESCGIFTSIDFI